MPPRRRQPLLTCRSICFAAVTILVAFSSVIYTISSRFYWAGKHQSFFCALLKTGCADKDINKVLSFYAADEKLNSVKNVFDSQFTRGDQKCAGITVFQGEKLLLHSYGGDCGEQLPWQNTGANNTAANEKNLYRVFSAGKMFESFAIAKLIEMGKIKSLDQKISEFWPEFGKYGKENITLAILLKHEGGLSFFAPREILADYLSLIEGGKEPNFSTMKSFMKTQKSNKIRRNLKAPEISFPAPRRPEVIQKQRNLIKKIIENQEPQWNPYEFKSGYHAVTRGIVVDQIVNVLDDKKRSMERFLQEEIFDKINSSPNKPKNSPKVEAFTGELMLEQFYDTKNGKVSEHFENLSKNKPNSEAVSERLLQFHQISNHHLYLKYLPEVFVPERFFSKPTGTAGLARHLIKEGLAKKGEKRLATWSATRGIIGITGAQWNNWATLFMFGTSSFNWYTNSYSMALLASAFNNKGRIFGEQIFSEDVIKQFTNLEPEKLFPENRLDMAIRYNITFTRGGFGLFQERGESVYDDNWFEGVPESQIREFLKDKSLKSEKYDIRTYNSDKRKRVNYAGWIGMGGSAFVVDFSRNLSIGYTRNGHCSCFQDDDLHDLLTEISKALDKK